MNNIGKGALGEYLAEQYLKKQGYKILSRNCKFYGAELDIVALYPVKVQKKHIKREYKEGGIKSKTALKCRLTALEDILVFVEVKYSSSRVYGEPLERVDRNKQKQIIKAAEAYMYRNRFVMPCRFDVVSILDKELTHLKDAFQA